MYLPTRSASFTLCDFHHALEPDTGHERIWGKIRYRYFTMVRAHKRKNPVTPGFHNVKAHVRRLELIDEPELEEIVHYYGISCPSCKSNISKFSVEKNTNKVNVSCGKCKKMWTGARKLAEETGPRLAEILSVSKNEGKWKCNWDMLEERSESAFRRLHSQMDDY